jgi:hypothetical protein
MIKKNVENISHNILKLIKELQLIPYTQTYSIKEPERIDR